MTSSDPRSTVHGVTTRGEPEVMRRYRHILRTAATDWQETAHRHALTTLGTSARAAILGEVQRLLLAGTRLGAHDTHDIARILVLAERRRPRVLLDGMRPDLLRRLATAVVESPAGRMLRAGYDVWDGEDPPLPPDPPLEVDHHQRWMDLVAAPDPYARRDPGYRRRRG